MRFDAVIPVVDHTFGVVDDVDNPVYAADWSSGLAIPVLGGALIYTGIDRGWVRVTVESLDAPPGNIDAGPWDDIVEVSVAAPAGRLRVHQLEYQPADEPPDLPVLSHRGSGTYRMRVHARHRDQHFDAVQDEPTEQYLLTLWPARRQPNLIIRATDQCGYGLRLASLQVTAPDPARRPPGERAQQERDALQRAALLRARPPAVSRAFAVTSEITPL